MPREKARTAGPVKTHGYAPCGLVCLLKRLVKQSLPQQNMQKLLSEQTVQRPRGVIDFVAEKRCNIFAARKPLLPERVAVADRDACFFADIPCRLHIPVNLPIQLKRAVVPVHIMFGVIKTGMLPARLSARKISRRQSWYAPSPASPPCTSFRPKHTTVISGR